MTIPSRRRFLSNALAAAGAAAALPALARAADKKPADAMKLGLVTYLWGKDWTLPELLANCEKGGVLGVELRTTHAHGVEPGLSATQRAEVRRRFEDSPVTHVGPGSNERFDNPDPAVVKKAIEATKAFIKLSHDTGGSGVKVKPDRFHQGVPREKTIEQIGRSLKTLGAFAADYGQEIRLEVHGQCAELPTIRAIVEVADHPAVGVCWNSNSQDLQGRGLEHNFNLVKDRFGATAHVRELNVGSYPYARLIELFVQMDYPGWILLECRTNPKDKVNALIEQRQVFEKMIAQARGRK